MPRADMAGDGGCHDADGAGVGDQHVLPHQIEGQRGVNRIAERVEDCADLIVDLIGQRHDIEGGQAQILGEGALFVDADPTSCRVQMELPGPALPRLLADQMPLAGTALSDGQPLDIAPDLHDLAGEFVARDKAQRNRPRRPVVPVPDMDVGAADAGLADADQHVIRPDLRHRAMVQPKPGSRLRLCQRLHVVAHQITPTALPAPRKASSAISRPARVSRAFICVRIRACPFGTTGKKKPET